MKESDLRCGKCFWFTEVDHYDRKGDCDKFCEHNISSDRISDSECYQHRAGILSDRVDK